MAELVLIYDSVTGGLRTNLLGAAHIVDASLVSSKFGSGQVGQFALASPAVFSGQVASGQVGAPHHGNQSVLSAHIGSGQVGAFALGPNVVMSAALASGQVGQYALASPSVFSGQIASGQVGQYALGPNVVMSAALASGQVGQYALASPSVFSGQMASGQIGPHIAAGGVLSAHFGSGQIGQFALASQSVFSGAIASGTIDLLHLRRFEAGVLNLLSGPYTNQEVRAQWLNPTAGFGVGVISAGVVINRIGWGDPNQAQYILSDNPYGLDIGIMHPTQSLHPGGFTRYVGEGSGATGVALLGGLFGSVEQFFGGTDVTTTNILSASYKIATINQSGQFEVAAFLASGHRMFGLVISGVISAGGLGLLSGILSGNIASGQVGGPHIAAGGIVSANYAPGSITGAHMIGRGIQAVNIATEALISGVFASGILSWFNVFPGGLTSASLASGLAHHVEAFITSTDANGFWSAAWKTAFGLSPAVTATPVRPLSGLARAAELFNITTALVNGITVNSGFIGAATSSVHVLAHDPTM